MSGGSIERTDIDQQWDRMIGMLGKLGKDTTNWTLHEGAEGELGRLPWVIEDDVTERRLVTLGYNRRAAMSALSAMNNILAVVLGA
jgi:hypothetical protein